MITRNGGRMMEGTTTEDYRLSMDRPDTNAMFSDDPVEALAYQWLDKPHRHVYDLCGEVDALNAELDKVRKELRKRTAMMYARRKR